MTDIIPEGSLVKISFEMRLPVAATDEQIDEWARYAVCQRTLTDEQVREVRALHADGEHSFAELAAKFALSKRSIDAS